MDIKDRCWIAGFLDGEGTFCISRRKPNIAHKEKSVTFQPKITCANTNKASILFLQQIVGGHFCKFKQYKFCYKPYYRWELYGSNILSFAKLILPYLKIKKQQAVLVMKLQSHIIKSKHLGRVPMAQKEIAYRQKIYEQIKTLNKRGI